MQLGMIGLGRMGANMVRRLLKGGHECVVFDMSPDTVAELAREKAVAYGAASRRGARPPGPSVPQEKTMADPLAVTRPRHGQASWRLRAGTGR